MKNSSLRICVFFGLALLLGGLLPFSAVSAKNDAQFTTHLPPPGTVCANTGIPISVTMKNTGDTNWNAGTGYALGSQNPRDNTVWGGWIGLSRNVVPGEQFEFVKWITTPSTPGTYNFQWQMVQDGVEWFGAMTPNSTVQVQNCAPIPPTPPTPPPPPPADRTAPSCQSFHFSLPSPQTRGATVIITPYATDNAGISKIEVYNSPPRVPGAYGIGTWELVGSTAFSGGPVVWNTSLFEPKSYVIGMKAYDTSNNVDDFSVHNLCQAAYAISSVPPVLTLLSPNGGETVNANSAYTISWSASNIDHVSLYYSLDSGRNWTQIAHPVYGTSYQWTTPVLSQQTYDPDNAYAQNQITTVRIRVVGENAQHQAQLQDDSNADFTLRSLQTAPQVSVYHSPSAPTASDSVTVIANVSSSQTSIRMIKIFVDGNEVRKCELQGYCTTFPNAYPAGSHSYFATAEDIRGNIGASSSQSFFVREGGFLSTPAVSHSPSSPRINDAVTVSASASQLTARLEVWVDGSLKHTCFAAAFCQYSSSFSAGTHNYYAVAYDASSNARNSGTQSFTVNGTSQPSVTNPSVAVFHSPVSPTASDYVIVNANASDPDGIQSIAMYVDGSLRNTCSSITTCQTPSQQYAAGSHSYYASATDYRGSIGTSTIQNFIVSGIPPVIPPVIPPPSLTIPAVFTSLSLTAPSSVDFVTITATASDPDGIQSITIYVDGSPRQNCSGTTTCQTSNQQYSVGSHTYYATAIDTRGTEGRAATQSFSVGQFPTQTNPQVSVSHSPLSPAATDYVTVTASASDSDGIQSISLYVDGSLRNTCSSITTCQTPSQQYSPGSHTYYAQAQDYRGSTGVSATQTFVVQNAPSQTLMAQFSASPSSGTAPLFGVSLSATVSGTAQGLVTYRFDCTGDGSWESVVSTFDSSYTATRLCSYSNPGTYNAKISAERNGMTSQGTVGISVQ